MSMTIDAAHKLTEAHVLAIYVAPNGVTAEQVCSTVVEGVRVALVRIRIFVIITTTVAALGSMQT